MRVGAPKCTPTGASPGGVSKRRNQSRVKLATQVPQETDEPLQEKGGWYRLEKRERSMFSLAPQTSISTSQTQRRL